MTAMTTTTTTTNAPTNRVHHVMVLIHGIMGNHKELLYVKEALEREFAANNSSSDNSLLVHAAKANDDNTLDGIEAGGKRLAEEINQLIQSLATTTKTLGETTTIALSILGNSLGGLYARFALAHIDWNFQPPLSDSQNKKVNIVPNLFVTTATPHLGIRDMTYWKVPKSFQPAGAWSMKQSGKDLFRYTDVIHRMCSEDAFLRPLANFGKRLAYANAFSTDAAVPTSTAAFLSDASSTIHIKIDDSSSSKRRGDDDNSVLHANSTYPTIRFRTDRSFPYSEAARGNDDDHQPDPKTEESVERYSQALDSLGWTKVFLDVRSHIPALWHRGSKRQDLHQMAQEPKATYTSSELSDTLSKFDWNTLPFGHSFMVASTKNSIYTWFYSGGRPLVDRIAKELVQEMVSAFHNNLTCHHQ